MDINEINRLMATEEPLDPELAKCLHTDNEGGYSLRVLQHPLVVTLYHERQNALLNAQLKAKKEHLAELVAKADWSAAVWFHERIYRRWAFERYREKMDTATAGDLLFHLWTDTEFPGHCMEEWLDLFREYAAHSPEMRQSRAALAGQSTLTVYRGTDTDEAEMAYGSYGMSWTTDLDKAWWFARRFRKDGVVLQATVRTDGVFMLSNDRGESEVVLDPETIEQAHPVSP